MPKNILPKILRQLIALSCTCFASADADEWVLVGPGGVDAVTRANFLEGTKDVGDGVLPPSANERTNLAKGEPLFHTDFLDGDTTRDIKPSAQGSAAVPDVDGHTVVVARILFQADTQNVGGPLAKDLDSTQPQPAKTSGMIAMCRQRTPWEATLTRNIKFLGGNTHGHITPLLHHQ